MSELKEKLKQTFILFKDTPIPEVPKEVMELRKKFSASPTPDLNDLTAIISKNLTLAAEVIMMANKPYCLGSRTSRVMTIRDAVTVIGSARLESLVMSSGFKIQMDRMALTEITDFSVAVATVCAGISEYVDTVSADEAYTVGLFHRAGTLLIAQRFDNYEKVFFESLKHVYRASQVEEGHLGTSHTLSGMLVAQKWEVGKRFTQIMLIHHQRNLQSIADEKTRTLVAIVQMACAIVIRHHYAEFSGEQVELMLQNAMDELMVDEFVLEESLSLIDDSFFKL